MPMSPVVMTVNTVAGNPLLTPFGPSQSAGTVTVAEVRQAVAYTRIEVNIRLTQGGGMYIPLNTGVDPAHIHPPQFPGRRVGSWVDENTDFCVFQLSSEEVGFSCSGECKL